MGTFGQGTGPVICDSVLFPDGGLFAVPPLLHGSCPIERGDAAAPYDLTAGSLRFDLN
jgi:hypothetical protein